MIHSPAPWKWTTTTRDKDKLIDANGKDVLSPVVGWDRTDLGIRTGEWGINNEGEKVARANAALIEAAPKLLRALEIADQNLCLECKERCRPQNDCCTSCDEHDARLRIIVEAKGT